MPAISRSSKMIFLSRNRSHPGSNIAVKLPSRRFEFLIRSKEYNACGTNVGNVKSSVGQAISARR